MYTSRLTGALGKMTKDPQFLYNYNKSPNVDMSRCARCGACCSGTSYLLMSDDETRRIKKYMQDKNIQPYNHNENKSVVRPTEIVSEMKSISLLYHDDIRPCPFYKPGFGCMIYPVRPLICEIYQCWDSEGFCETRSSRLSPHHNVRNMETEIYS